MERGVGGKWGGGFPKKRGKRRDCEGGKEVVPERERKKEAKKGGREMSPGMCVRTVEPAYSKETFQTPFGTRVLHN